MTIQITVKDYSELRLLAEQVLSGEQRKEAQGTPCPAKTEAVPEPETIPQPVVEPEAPAVPISEEKPVPATYTLDDLTKAGVALMDAGKKKELQDLLAKYGVPSLPALDKGQFEAFAGDLRSLGAEI